MIEQLLSELRAGLAILYGNRLKGVYLFGSYARGDHDQESDLDILIILDDIVEFGTEIRRTGELASNLSLKYGISISRKFISEDRWLQGDSVLLRNVRAEAVEA
ncbi:MAG TPA: nucleotidyltransferase domain-containing protein [Anaerolineales bacterium]|jgi:predicted nucleotidyltransferase